MSVLTRGRPSCSYNPSTSGFAQLLHEVCTDRYSQCVNLLAAIFMKQQGNVHSWTQLSANSCICKLKHTVCLQHSFSQSHSPMHVLYFACYIMLLMQRDGAHAIVSRDDCNSHQHQIEDTACLQDMFSIIVCQRAWRRHIIDQ